MHDGLKNLVIMIDEEYLKEYERDMKRGIKYELNRVGKGNTIKNEEQINKIKEMAKRHQDTEEQVKIGNNVYFKSQETQIGKKVLNLCNYNKTKHFNSHDTLKYGEGKLSMTNGLTLNEFRKKFKLVG